MSLYPIKTHQRIFLFVYLLILSCHLIIILIRMRMNKFKFRNARRSAATQEHAHATKDLKMRRWIYLIVVFALQLHFHHLYACPSEPFPTYLSFTSCHHEWLNIGQLSSFIFHPFLFFLTSEQGGTLLRVLFYQGTAEWPHTLGSCTLLLSVTLRCVNSWTWIYYWTVLIGTQKTALVALNSLQSNVATLAAWTASRKDGTIDYKEEMMHHINAIGINVSRKYNQTHHHITI